MKEIRRKSFSLTIKNTLTNKIKTHPCDSIGQVKRLKYYFQQTGNYEVLN